MRDSKIHDPNRPSGRHGGHKGKWQQGDAEAANDEVGRQGRGGRRHDHHGARRNRARRGDARYILLDALRDGPKHGYEIIKALEERSTGQYIPSPGTVYPTLQYLEDQGFVRATQEAERRIYQLTATGQTELDAQAEQVTAFWARFASQHVVAAAQHEVSFLQDELEHLNRIVWSGLRPAIDQGQQDSIRRVRNAVEACQKQIREMIAHEMIAHEMIATEQTQ